MPGAKPVRKLTPAQQKTVEDNLRLAYAFASKWRAGFPELADEILSACMYGLTKAVVLYDASKSKLSTYAWWAMRHEVYSLLGCKGDRSLERLHDPDRLNAETVCPDTDRMERRSIAAVEIERLLPLLPERQRRIIHKRYWLGQTLKEIGEQEGCTRERVRQIILQSLEIMRRRKS